MSTTIFDQVVFVSTGILSTIAAQILIDGGAGSAWTQLLPLANYSGMALAGYIPRSVFIQPSKAGRSLSDGPDALPARLTGDSQQPWPISQGPTSISVGHELVRRSGSSGDEGSSLGVASTGAPLNGAGALQAGMQHGGADHVPLVCGYHLTLNRYVAAAVTLDLLGFWFHVVGLSLTGSAVFQVLYASVVVWAALGSRLVRGPSAALNAAQWTGIVIVLFGLLVSAAWEGGHTVHAGKGDAAGKQEKEEDALRAWGVAASLACAVTYGTVYTLGEVLMSKGSVAGPVADPSPHVSATATGSGSEEEEQQHGLMQREVASSQLDPAVIATRVGGSITCLLSVYIILAVLPRWGEVLASVADAGRLSWTSICVGYVTLMGSAALHAISYYRIMGSAGAVATGLMQAARAVGVFLVSALLFCKSHGAHVMHGHSLVDQCLTMPRALATILVCGGIYVFSLGKAAAKSLGEEALPAIIALPPSKKGGREVP